MLGVMLHIFYMQERLRNSAYKSNLYSYKLMQQFKICFSKTFTHRLGTKISVNLFKLQTRNKNKNVFLHFNIITSYETEPIY